MISKSVLISILFYLLSNLLKAQLQNYSEPVIDCSRVIIPNSLSLDRQNYRIPLRNSSSAVYGIVISLSSFQQSTITSIKVIDQNQTGFVISATKNIRALSYLAVELSSFYNVGIITSIYLPPVVKYDQDLLQSNLAIRGYNQWLQKTGNVQPFLSEISYFEANFTIKNAINISWIWQSNNLKIMRSRQITKITISFLIYSKIGRTYLNIIPPSALNRFNLKNNEMPIFIGIRNVSFQIKKNERFYLLWTKSLRADIFNIDVFPYIVLQSNSTCYTNRSYLNGVMNPLSMMACTQSCYSYSAYVKNYKICLNFELNRTSLSWFPNGTYSTYEISDQITCQRFTVEAESLVCAVCNNNKHFVAWSNGSCICQQGFFLNKETFKSNPQCQRCLQTDCILDLETVFKLNYFKQNSTEQIQIQVGINKNNTVIPSETKDYISLEFSFFVNNQKIEPLLNWRSQNIVKFTLQNFTLSDAYTIIFRVQNSILVESEGIYLYLSPKKNYQLRIAKGQNSIKETMETVNNITHAVAYVSVIFASKINIFSFIQLNSMLFLTSIVKWRNYGSLSRLKITRDFFKLEPTNIFNSLNLNLPIPEQFHASKRNESSVYGQRRQFSIMYMCLAPSYILSLVIQIVLIELIVRVAKLILIMSAGKNKFVQSEQFKFSKNEQGQLIWIKPSYLCQIIESGNRSNWQKAKKIWDNISSKRFIFYTNLFNSQLIFHIYIIFLQFKITPTSQTQIVNFVVAISILGLIICGICLGPHQPYSKYKALCLIYKRSKYTQPELSFYYYLNLTEIAVFAASIAMFENSFQQCIASLVLNVCKLIVMRRALKRMEMVKLVLIIIFMSLLAVGDHIGSQKQYIQLVAIVCMLLISSIQVFKIAKSIFVNSLGLLKSTPSEAGKQIISKIKQRLKRD